jgi:hypothetical protein
MAFSVAESYEWTGNPPRFAPNAFVIVTFGFLIAAINFITFGTRLKERFRAAGPKAGPGLRFYVGTALFLALLFLLVFAVTRNYAAFYVLGLALAWLGFSGFYRFKRRQE